MWEGGIGERGEAHCEGSSALSHTHTRSHSQTHAHSPLCRCRVRLREEERDSSVVPSGLPVPFPILVSHQSTVIEEINTQRTNRNNGVHWDLVEVGH